MDALLAAAPGEARRNNTGGGGGQDGFNSSAKCKEVPGSLEVVKELCPMYHTKYMMKAIQYRHMEEYRPSLLSLLRNSDTFLNREIFYSCPWRYPSLAVSRFPS